MTGFRLYRLPDIVGGIANAVAVRTRDVTGVLTAYTLGSKKAGASLRGYE
ncbi:hypothetical protein BJ981_003816 [Sphaerisporangium krabiense]|uniref:Uncharacterized protein n=1 Tax=Sphaerisporangium krabiense TaxID=763782 RepID=A0A7W9DR04_9ACTN|nr:hypothetical protein [Sphaerisporangium krabiense]